MGKTRSPQQQEILPPPSSPALALRHMHTAGSRCFVAVFTNSLLHAASEARKGKHCRKIYSQTSEHCHFPPLTRSCAHLKKRGGGLIPPLPSKGSIIYYKLQTPGFSSWMKEMKEVHSTKRIFIQWQLGRFQGEGEGRLALFRTRGTMEEE